MSVPLRPLIATEWRLHRRHGVVVASAAVAGAWALVVLVLPASWREPAVPWVLFLDVTALGFFFVPALTVVERAHGVTAAHALSRLTATRWLAVRVGMFAVTAVAAALVVTVAAGMGGALEVVVGVGLATALLSLLAVLMVGRSTTLTGYLARVPFVAAPLLAPALLAATGLWDAPLLALSPMTGAFELLAGRWSWTAAAWLAVGVGALWPAAARLLLDPALSAAAAPSAATRTAERLTTRPARGPDRDLGGDRHGWWAAVASFARVDRRTLLDDRLLALILAGVPVLALAVRWLAGPGAAWVEGRYGVDVRGELPLIAAFVVVVHTPVMLGSVVGLLFLEDRDAGVLPAIALTRRSLGTLAAYRLGGLAAVTVVAVLIGLPLSGVPHAAGLAGTAATAIAGGALAGVPAVLLATLAHDRAQGMAWMKALGVPLYAPLAWWFVDGPAGWLFGLVPAGWAARAAWAGSAPAAWGFAAGGVGLSVAIGAVLLPRMRRSLL